MRKKYRLNAKGKKRITLLLSLVLLISAMGIMTLTSSASGDVTINIDGKALEIDPGMGAPFIDKNSRTQVPLNAAMSAIGAKVTWNGAERVAAVEKDGITVKVPIGESYILKDGQRIDNDTEAIIKDQRTYLPIRVVMEAFGAKVGWDGTTRTVIITTPDSEMRAMWISYLEFLDMPKTENNFRNAIDKKFDQCVDYGMNTVIVQVRADSDAMYESQVFPWSKFASGTQGKDPGYDPLEYMIQAAHKRNLEFHAWINPYRITGYKMSWSEVSDDNPAKIRTADGSVKNDRNVLLHNGFYYYNPSSEDVRQLVVDGVREIVERYDVDGIHFDDYFYPSLSDKSEETWFDKPEYEASGSKMSISDWRRENVNLLIREVYRVIKAHDEDILFGVSPAGNVDNLRSNSSNFVDIDTWMSQDGYVDYIMPQLYWGFETKTVRGEAAPWAFGTNLKTWINLKKQGNVDLYIGLNVANAGSAIRDYNEVSEWIRYDDILARQVRMARDSGEVGGFAFFRHDTFETEAAQKEVTNLIKELKQ